MLEVQDNPVRNNSKEKGKDNHCQVKKIEIRFPACNPFGKDRVVFHAGKNQAVLKTIAQDYSETKARDNMLPEFLLPYFRVQEIYRQDDNKHPPEIPYEQIPGIGKNGKDFITCILDNTGKMQGFFNRAQEPEYGYTQDTPDENRSCIRILQCLEHEKKFFRNPEKQEDNSGRNEQKQHPGKPARNGNSRELLEYFARKEIQEFYHSPEQIVRQYISDLENR